MGSLSLSFDGQIWEGWNLGSENDCGQLFVDEVWNDRFLVSAYVVGFYDDLDLMSRMTNLAFLYVVHPAPS